MIFNLRNPLGKRGGTVTEDSFQFSGSYAFARDEESGNWELALWDSGSLTWLVDPGQVDLCVIGAGQDGGDGALTDYNYQYGVYTRVASGKGGDGGRILNAQGVSLDAALTVVVGESGADSSIGSYTSANGPAPKAGGTAASMPLESNAVGTVNKGGAAGVWPFSEDVDSTMIPELQGHRIGASGGAGMANNAYVSYWSVNPRKPIYDPVYTANHGGINVGGATDGANGSPDTSHLNGYDATGIGNGGGGGYGDGRAEYGDGTHGVGGAGSKGAVLIRNHREA